MMWSSLQNLQTATRIEFVPALARQHHFVRCLNGKWTRTLGAPGAPEGTRLVHVRGRVWHLEALS